MSVCLSKSVTPPVDGYKDQSNRLNSNKSEVEAGEPDSGKAAHYVEEKQMSASVGRKGWR